MEKGNNEKRLKKGNKKIRENGLSNQFINKKGKEKKSMLSFTEKIMKKSGGN